MTLSVCIEVNSVFGVIDWGKWRLLSLLDCWDFFLDAALLQVLNWKFLAVRISFLALGIFEDALPKEFKWEGKHSQGEAANLIKLPYFLGMEAHLYIGWGIWCDFDFFWTKWIVGWVLKLYGSLFGGKVLDLERLLAAALQGALIEIEISWCDSYFGHDGNSLELEVEMLVLVVEIGTQGVVPFLFEVDLCVLAQDVVAEQLQVWLLVFGQDGSLEQEGGIWLELTLRGRELH